MIERRTPGAYILLFRLDKETAVEVGRLGVLSFPPGHYAYVGSAMGGLQARVERHISGGKRKHWHIDHVICNAVERRALLFPSGTDIECSLAELVSGLEGAERGPDGFGSSDCRCRTHLFRLSEGAVAKLDRISERGWAPGNHRG